MNPARLILLICLVLLGVSLVSADTADEAARRAKELEAFRESQYPRFVGGSAPVATPTPSPTRTPVPDAAERGVQIDDEVDAFTEVIELPGEPRMPAEIEADVLVADITSTTTWMRVRERMEPHLEQLRILVITSATMEDLVSQTANFSTDLGVLAESAAFQAPRQREAIVYTTSLLQRYLRVLESDYIPADPGRAGTVLPLLGRSMAELEILLAMSDEDRGMDAPGWRLPADWDVGGFRAPDFAPTIATMAADQLLAEFRFRNASLQRNLRLPPAQWDLQSVLEMGELARELANRVQELPASSRTGFRNAALRLDVLAESLHDFMSEGNYLYARRHQRTVEWAARDVENYLITARRFGL